MTARRNTRKLVVLIFLTSFGILLYKEVFMNSDLTMENEKDTIIQNITSNMGLDEKDNKCGKGHRFSQSEWFQRKLNRKVIPFWTEDNINVARDILAWWFTIQRSPSVNLKPTLKKLYALGVPKHHKDNRPKKKDKCLTCAVVGNSGNLKGSNYGKDIDAHAVVIRHNQGPIHGFEKDVGTKTTYRILYPESAMDVPQNTSLTLAPFKTLDVEWMLSAITTGKIQETHQKVKNRVSCNISRIAILHPEFIRYVYVNFLEKHGTKPSTGLIGVGLAFYICDKVNIYGFGADKHGIWQHYWENLTFWQTIFVRFFSTHDIDIEKNFLNKLESEGVVRIYRGLDD